MAIVHSMYREPGTVSIDRETCTRCGMCAGICPADVLQMNDGKLSVSDESPFGCIACGQCMMACPEDAVTVSGRGVSPRDLFPLPPPEKRADAEALEALMQSRRSIRRFDRRPVDPELLERVTAMASTAPMGIPPWDVGVIRVTGRQEVQNIAVEIIQGYTRFLKVFKPWLLASMRPFIGKARHDLFADFILPLARMYVDGSKEKRDLLFYDAPALLIFHHSPYADELDAGIACTYAMLAAESLGLGNTIIGGAPPMMQRNKALCRRLGIPDGNKPSAALILGYPSVSFRKTIRRRFAHESTVGARPEPERCGPE